jgi:tripartite-type tricarboxylate transporter receptor subunit TctC
MNSTRRSMIKAAAALPLLATCSTVFAQQPYPTKPVKIIVPAGAGTGIDAITRFFADRLSKRLGQPFLPDNRAGAGGLIGYTQLTKSAPDGYTLILTGIPLYLLPLFSEAGGPSYDPQLDFAPIARVARVPQAIVVAPDSPYKTMADLLDAMKNAPGEITHSSQGPGSAAHLCAVVLADLSKTKARHVPYKESRMALTDVAAGRVNFTCLSSAQMLPLIQGGRLRVLGVTNSRRWDSLPNVPTVAEAGVPGFEVSSQLDFMAPAHTPEPILQLLSNEIGQIAQGPDFKEYCVKQAIAPEFMDYKVLVPEVARETARWKRIALLARG